MTKGMCGILKPNGEFISCGYGEHWQIVKFIPKSETDKCLVFSSPIGKNLGIINGSDVSCVACDDWENGITKAQYEWIIAHRDDFDDTQNVCLSIVYNGYVDVH